ncbi:hypothetical protein [Sanguibacter suaedae]|uniref:Uncharacterized protein n=1 Tax=Sanguibacter suaedae TaxID=2795737 RepID=A0A934I289_9MICO|nr:hypothetical protein [Sanguibacter suaedae]MBI9114244.1 hypothetical protein [Sanguibacter suaedae]
MPGTTDDPENVPDDAAPSGSGPASDPSDRSTTDEAWARIVAELSDLSTDPEPERTPSGEDGPPPAEVLGFPTAPWVGSPRTPRPSASGPRDWDGDDGDEGEFVPPDPGFRLGDDKVRNLGWAAVVAAPLLGVLAAIFWRTAPTELFVAATAVFLTGVGVLVWRLPTDRDDPGDGGAVV